MAYGLRFRGEWLNKLGGLSRFDIEERDFLGNAEIMDMQEDPLDTERANMGDNTSVGSGCELRVTATYDGQYLDLYTKDAQKFKAKHYKDGRLIWIGYLNSEVYTESYDRVRDYPVTLQFNDGMAVLERIKFLKNNGEPYTELMTAWNVIAYIIDRLGLEFQYLYTAFDIYEKAMDTTMELLQQIKVDTRNYYDEKGEPLNCREVLEAIISPFYAVCFTNEACLNIVRKPLLSRVSYTRKRYALGSSVCTNQVVNPCLSIPSQVDFYQMDQQIDMVAGNNKAAVKYSPYGIEDLFEGIDISNSDNWNNAGVWADKNGWWEFTGVTGSDGWELIGDKIKIKGSRESEFDKGDYYISAPYEKDTNTPVIKLVDNAVRVTGCKNVLKIKFKVFVRTKDNEYNSDEEGETLFRFNFFFTIKIGNKYLRFKSPYQDDNGNYLPEFPAANYDPNLNPWVAFQPARGIKDIEALEWFDNYNKVCGGIEVDKKASFPDRWEDVEITLPPYFPTGDIDIQICSKFYAWHDRGGNTGTELVDEDDRIKEIRFKDFEAIPMDYEKSTNSGEYNYTEADFDDIEFVGEMNDQWINEAPDIDMIHGDSKENNCTDRGGFHLPNEEFTGEWKTFLDSQYYELAPLLLRSFISNYRDSKFKLSGTVEASNIFNGNGLNIDGVLSFHSVLTYPGSTIANKKLMFMGGIYNDKAQTISGNWVEILDDDLTINEQ